MKAISKICIVLNLLFQISNPLFSQNVGINSTGAFANASALLDLDASPSNSTGLLIPRIPLQATNLAAPTSSPATSLLVYNTATAGSGTTAVVPGFYYWDGTMWVRFQNSSSARPDWNLQGNAGTTAGTDFIGTTDNQDFVLKTNNTEKMRLLSGGKLAIGTTTAHPSALVEMYGTNQGFLMPRLTNAQILAIASPADGLMVYNRDCKVLQYFDGISWRGISKSGTPPTVNSQVFSRHGERSNLYSSSLCFFIHN